MNRHHAAAVLLAAGLALTGCGTGSDGPKKQTPLDPAATAAAVAVEYQRATLALDWQRACELSTQRLRAGTVDECVDRHTPDTKAPTASASATATFDPPRYADGSTMPPPKSKTTSPGPDRASTGPVTVERSPVEVPAIENYTAGYGVLLSFTVTWPNETTVSRKAVRVVQEGGAWKVDQREDVQKGDTVQGDPILNALGS